LYPSAKAVSGDCCLQTGSPQRTRLVTLRQVVLALGLVANVFAGNNTDALRSASDSARSTVQQALIREDAETLASVFSENGSVVVPTGQTIHGRTTIKSMAALMMMTWGGGKLKITRDSLQVKDSTGYEIGRFAFRRAVKDMPDQVWSGGYTAIWGMEEGIWRISRVTGLMNPPHLQTEKPNGK
jgi:ketosteroid isomerase-like protein